MFCVVSVSQFLFWSEASRQLIPSPRTLPDEIYFSSPDISAVQDSKKSPEASPTKIIDKIQTPDTPNQIQAGDADKVIGEDSSETPQGVVETEETKDLALQANDVGETDDSKKVVESEDDKAEESDSTDTESKNSSTKASDDSESPDKTKVASETLDESATEPEKNAKPENSVTKQNLTPKQKQKQLDMEKKFKERQRMKEEKEKLKLKEKQEKEKQKQEREAQRLKEKQEKIEQKQKEIEEKEEKKKKEREEKEKLRKEKEEQKRKEKEEKEDLKRKEIEEKNKEKLKEEEKKQKAVVAFANFFKKVEEKKEAKGEEMMSSLFMPFEVKSDMRVAPLVRAKLTEEEKENLCATISTEATRASYLSELKSGKGARKSGKTWPYEDNLDDVVFIEENSIGDTIVDDSIKPCKMRAKLLQFRENRRPAYFGTWRKRSKSVGPRKPTVMDKIVFDYDVDSGDDWEEEDPCGESLCGSEKEDDEKATESENEYEVDNEFFVPHGHLSDDEINEEDQDENDDVHKAKLDILQNEFDEEMKSKTEKINPRVIGPVWVNKVQDKENDPIHKFLKTFAVICNGPIAIKKRSEFSLNTPLRKKIHNSYKIDEELIPVFLKMIHGKTVNQGAVATAFQNYVNEHNIVANLSKAGIIRQLKTYAEWIKNPEDGKKCWIVREDVQKEYDLQLSIPAK